MKLLRAIKPKACIFGVAPYAWSAKMRAYYLSKTRQFAYVASWILSYKFLFDVCFDIYQSWTMDDSDLYDPCFRSDPLDMSNGLVLFLFHYLWTTDNKL